MTDGCLCDEGYVCSGSGCGCKVGPYDYIEQNYQSCLLPGASMSPSSSPTPPSASQTFVQQSASRTRTPSRSPIETITLYVTCGDCEKIPYPPCTEISLIANTCSSQCVPCGISCTYFILTQSNSKYYMNNYRYSDCSNEDCITYEVIDGICECGDEQAALVFATQNAQDSHWQAGWKFALIGLSAGLFALGVLVLIGVGVAYYF